MKFKHNLSANLHKLIYFANTEITDEVDDQSNENNFGVGAVMPQDMPEYRFFTGPESYAV